MRRVRFQVDSFGVKVDQAKKRRWRQDSLIARLGRYFLKGLWMKCRSSVLLCLPIRTKTQISRQWLVPPRPWLFRVFPLPGLLALHGSVMLTASTCLTLAMMFLPTLTSIWRWLERLALCLWWSLKRKSFLKTKCWVQFCSRIRRCKWSLQR